MNERFPWRILGRRFKPLALASALSVLAVALSPFYSGPAQTFDFGSPPGIVQAGAAGVAFICLVIGWFQRSSDMVRGGLLLVAGVFMARATLTALSVGLSHPAFWINFSWVVATGGAYLLERDDDHHE